MDAVVAQPAMSDDDGLGIAARLAIGVLVSIVATIVSIETLAQTLEESLWLVPFVLAGLVMLWVVGGAARDDGGARKAGIWTLLGIAVASVCTTLFCVIAVVLVYMILIHPPGP